MIVGIGIMATMIYYGIPGYILIKNEPFLPAKEISQEDKFSLSETQKAMEELFSIIENEYYDVDQIDEASMSRQAISSFVSGLWDPFTSYYSPEQSKEVLNDISGDSSIEWIWAVLSQTQVGIMIEEVINGSPAFYAGLRPLDVIINVDWEDVQQQDITSVVNKIRGEKWTVVEITVLRIGTDGSVDTIQESITRDIIEIPSVSSKILTGPNDIAIGYIALSIFAADTDYLLLQAIDELRHSDIKGIILDLRGNGGWLLPESVSVVSHFLRKGSPVVNVDYRIYRNNKYKAEWGDKLSQFPIVILTNEYTASASEIITLALRENRCPGSTHLTIQDSGTWSVLSDECTAIVVWQRTFWKWTVQSLQNLKFGWSLKLTVWKWFSPSNVSIHEKGILPDHLIDMDVDIYFDSWVDTQLEAAEKFLSDYIGWL